MANGLPPAAWGEYQPEGRQFYGQVFFADNGSIQEVALKMALQAQQQRGETTGRFISLERLSGETVATLAVSDVGLYGDPYRPLFFR